MKSVLRILVPTNFSSESTLALEWAMLLAQKKHGTTLYLLHVLPEAATGMGSIGYEKEMEARKSKMEAFQKVIPGDVLYFSLYHQGRPAEIIEQVCKEKDIDLVVMTTEGRRGMSRILEGSITEEVVRVAPCPVFVLHQNTKTPAAQPFS